MKYWAARADLEFMAEFADNVAALLQFEHDAAPAMSLSSNRRTLEAAKKCASIAPEYQQLRTNVAGAILRAKRIAARHGVNLRGTSYPPPMFGGMTRPFNLFDAILFDPSHAGIEPQLISDALVQTIAACQDEKEKERRRLYNPFCWLFDGFVWVLRFPFMLLGAADFNQKEIEKHMLAKIFKLIEAGILLLLGLWYGLSKTDLINILKDLF